MSLDYELLRVLHHKLQMQTELKSQIERGPKKILLAKSTEEKFEQEMAVAKESLTKAKMAADERQLHLGEREAKVVDLKNRLNAAESNREYQLLKDTIAADEQANSVLADEIFEMLEKIDQLEIELATAKENYAKAQDETKKMVSRIEQELVVQKAELAEVESQIAEREAKIPVDIKPTYQRQVNAKQDNALSFAKNKETCGNCNQRLTAQIQSDLTMQKAVFCKGCGALMYATVGSVANS